MTPERHERVQAVFLSACRRAGDDRDRYLDEACGSDADLRREVEELLSFHTASGKLTAFQAAASDAAGRAVEAFAVGTVLDGKFVIQAVIGEGGMGTVFRATQIALERPVAIKVIRPSLLLVPGVVERLRREALAVARLRHPSVVAIYDFCTTPNGAYLVMELVEGESLADAILRTGRMAVPHAVGIIQQIAAAVHAAHQVGVVHRDLKPGNVLLEPPASAPRVKVLDFGVAKVAEASGPTITNDGAPVGTPLYMSPEQAMGGACDARTDVYALGCILYELLTGEPPFTGPGVARVLIAHTTKAPKPPSHREPSVPAWLDVLVLKALEKEREQRFQTAEAFAAALGDMIQESSGARAQARERVRAEPEPDVEPSPSRRPNNLPSPLTSFVGRKRDVAEILSSLEIAPLVTLTGPGGVGKTRLAIRAASALLDHTDDDGPDECRYVDLAPLGSPSGVAAAVAAVLDVRADSDGATVAEIVRHVAPRRLLLVLDNCEHVVAGVAALLGELLGACPDLSVLATSRASLHVAGETVYAVASLDVPETADADEAHASEAVRLFVERAQLVSTVFRATSENIGAVVEICRHLDGLPLAIELAAARARILTVHQIRDRLHDRLRLLRATGASGRHESLRAAIDWSYGMLGATESALFDRLSVFSGGFTLDAIEAVCSDETVDALDVLDILAGLVDKSLVGVTHSAQEARYALLETMRQYAAGKLDASGDTARVRARHRDHFLDLAEKAGEKIASRDGATWGARLQSEIDNLRAALGFSRDEPDGAPSFLRLAVALHKFFYERGYLGEGRAWLEAALDCAGDDAPAALRTTALTGLGNIVHDQGDLETAREYQERALAINREVGNKKGIAAGLHNVGNILLLTGDYRAASDRFAESLEICRELGGVHNVALSIFTQACVAIETADWGRANDLITESGRLYTSIDYTYGLSLVRTEQAYAAMIRGEIDRAGPLLDDALAHSRSVGNRHNVATVAAYRANIARHLGRLDEAETYGAEALAEFRALGDKDCTSMALHVLARAARQRGETGLAGARLDESLALRARLGLRKGLAEGFEEAATIALARDDARTAARLFGAAARLRETIGAPVQPVDAADRAAPRKAAREALGDGAFDEAFDDGAALPAADAVSLARAAFTG